MTLSARVTPVLAIAAAWWLLADVTAVWGPSLITIFGQAAATPPELMGLYALACVLTSYVVVLTVRWQPLVPLGIAAAARLLLAVQPGDQWQLWGASIGVAAALAWLAVVTTRNADALAPGIAAGWTLQVASAVAGGTWLAVWRSDAHGVVSLLLLLTLLGVTARAALDPSDGAGGAGGAAEPRPRLTRRQAWSLLPVGLLAGVAFNPGRASTVDVAAGPAVLILGCLLAVLAARRPWGRAMRTVWVVVAVSSVAASLYGTAVVGGVPGSLSLWVLAAFAVGPAALATSLQEGAVAGEPVGAGVRAVLGGGVVWVLLLFAYYAGYDLGYRADLLLVVATVLVSALAVRRAAAGHAMGPTVVPALAAGAVLALVLAPGATPEPGTVTVDGEWKLVTYNVRMGYGMDGRFDPQAVADVIGDADVVLLQEVDRGWLLNGGQDQLAILSRLTGKALHFGPAADPVWGDAVLTSLPVRSVRGAELPSYGAVTGAGWLAVEVEVDGRPVWVLCTHVQPTTTRTDGTVDQARDLADVVRSFTEDGTPVVLGGDLNLEPWEGTASWRAVTRRAGLVDALAAHRPVPTSDSLDPVNEIDHVLVSPGISATGGAAVRTTASDHLPVRITLRLAD